MRKSLPLAVAWALAIVSVFSFLVCCSPVSERGEALELCAPADGSRPTSAGVSNSGAVPLASSAGSSTPIELLTPIPSTRSPDVASPEAKLHVVQSGDTLLGLARQYGVPMASIQLANDLGESTVIQLGQALTIPIASQWKAPGLFWRLHIVGRGETLSGIARAYSIDVAQLALANGLDNADHIQVGQTLVLPLEEYVESDTSLTPATPTPKQIPTGSAALLATRPTAESFSPSPSPELQPSTGSSTDDAGWSYETARLINEVRSAYGLPPLVYDETLALAAQGQAGDCAQRGWCNHTGSDGSDIGARVLRAGYDAVTWAECWAQRQTPEGAVAIWMDEEPPDDPHRRTLLTTWLTEIGVGVAKTSWGYYFIADFGRPSE